MTKITTLVGADITERLFLSRFGELCSDPLFHIRKVSHKTKLGFHDKKYASACKRACNLASGNVM